jgi:hypothetical protein
MLSSKPKWKSTRRKMTSQEKNLLIESIRHDSIYSQSLIFCKSFLPIVITGITSLFLFILLMVYAVPLNRFNTFIQSIGIMVIIFILSIFFFTLKTYWSWITIYLHLIKSTKIDISRNKVEVAYLRTNKKTDFDKNISLNDEYEYYKSKIMPDEPWYKSINTTNFTHCYIHLAPNSQYVFNILPVNTNGEN